MCVTNTTRRQPVSLAPSQVNVCPGVLSQRLLSTFPLQIPAGVSQPGIVNSQPPEFNAQQEKPKPKRRRKPQKPGKTAKMNDRHFVVHNYHDHASDPDDTEEPAPEDPNQRRRGGVAVAFPLKLHAVLDQVEADGLGHIISWQAHGRCFVVHKPKEFVDHVMPKYFRQTKLTSFQRQLNLYGFCRLTRGKDAGGYYHELFLRGKTYLCKKMIRTKVKGTKFKAASSPDQEPDFYSMPPVLVTPPTTDEEASFGSHPQQLQDTSQMFLMGMGMQQAQQQMMQPRPLPLAGLPMLNSPPTQLQGKSQAPANNIFQGTTNQMTASQMTANQMGPVAPPPCEADRVLDEAVDELFLRGDPLEGDNLSEFVHDWDPTNFGESLQDDAQLGFMLEKLLEE